MQKNNFISSSDNTYLKLIRKLSNKKNRYKEKKFVIESRKMLEEAIENNQDIDFILLSDKLENVDEIFNDNSNIKIVKDELFKSVSTLTSPDGYLACLNFTNIDKPLSNKVLVLDHLQDPGNLGTLIRSAEAFGFNDIYLYECVDIYNEKVLRSTMGSVFRLNIKRVKRDDIDKLRKNHVFYTADMGGQDFRKVDFAENIALVIGNEANGLSTEFRTKENKIIAIPMMGKVESLNAAISGTLIMAQTIK